MQKLMLAEDVFDALVDGKDVTIRKGRRDIQLGELLFESVDEHRKQIVNVKMVVYCNLDFIPEDFVWSDGFDSHEDMEEKMKRFYPDITADTECTVVVFDTENEIETEKEE